LQFLEQAHVLDRDHCLVGKGLEERDLLVGERLDLDASERKFFEEPDVLDDDDRLVGEGFEERDLLGRERIGLGPPIHEDHAQRRALAQQRRRHHRTVFGPGPPHAGHGARELPLGRQDVLDMDRLPVGHDSSADEVPTDREGLSDRHWSAQRSTPRHETQLLPFETVDRRVHRPAHPGGVLDDGLHDRLQIGRRTRDHPQDLTRGGLLLERLFRLVEQPHVLDGDHGLSGEGVEEVDLPVGEEPGLDASHHDRSDRSAVSEHWDGHDAAEGGDPCDRAECVVWIGRDVGNVLHDSGPHGPARGASPVCRRRIRAAVGLDRLGRQAVVRNEVEVPSVKAKDGAELGVTQLLGTPGDGVEDGLNVGRRAGDDPQDLAGGRLLLQGFG
jgi:hypothetical protein